jgi:hypothetical protein
MDRRSNTGLKVGVAVVAALAVVAVGVPLGLNLILGSDYERSPISLDDSDSGTRVVVEPGDEFNLGLLGHPDHPAAVWEVAAADPAVVEIRSSGHEPSGAGLPADDEFLASISADRRSWYGAVFDRPPDVEDEAEPGGGVWFVPLTMFDFAVADFGDSPVRLEIEVAGEAGASFEFEVSVVEDACSHFGEANTAVPHRCG